VFPLLSIAAISLLALADSPKPDTACPTAASVLVQDVARKYAGMHSYVVRVDQTIGEFGRPGNFGVVTLAVNDSNHFAYRPKRQEIPMVVGNGSTLRFYHPRLNEYIEEPVPGSGQGMKLFAKTRDRFVTRFATINQYAASARLLGKKQLEGVEVLMLEIRSKPGESHWVDRLWIDPATKLVRKVVRLSTPASVTSETYFDEVKYQYSYVNQPVPQTYFELKLPPNASKKKSFSFRPGFYSDPPMSIGPLGEK
jgi:outer membrane lipoprotein-sorting protein